MVIIDDRMTVIWNTVRASYIFDNFTVRFHALR